MCGQGNPLTEWARGALSAAEMFEVEVKCTDSPLATRAMLSRSNFSSNPLATSS